MLHKLDSVRICETWIESAMEMRLMRTEPSSLEWDYAVGVYLAVYLLGFNDETILSNGKHA